MAFFIRETPDYQSRNFFHFTVSEGRHKAVVRGSCHLQVCFPWEAGWWICIPALSGWLLAPSSQTRLTSDFWFWWAPDKRPRLVQFMSHAAIFASFGWSALRPRPWGGVWNKKKEVKQLLKAFCTSLAQIQERPFQAWEVCDIPVIDFYSSAKDQVFLTAWHTW